MKHTVVELVAENVRLNKELEKQEMLVDDFNGYLNIEKRKHRETKLLLEALMEKMLKQ